MKKQQSNLNTNINLSTTSTASGSAVTFLNGTGYSPTATTYTTGNYGNINSQNIATATSGWIDTNTYSTIDIQSSLNSFFQYFSEKEIDEMFDKIISRDSKSESNNYITLFNNSGHIIQDYVKNNHCSEDFLIKYYNLKIINRPIINYKHSRYIRTGEYPTLALLLELEEK